ncbi:cytochrome P450 2C44-like isoform X4 [Pseudophryne corroboree]|uniref:cytochrome P450 2C44-like isoform X4 n=1 Tax=Pseudophryne corroboree TaxID=495146 RepID=UPI003081B422
MIIFSALSLAAFFLLSLLFFLSIWRKQKKYQFLPPGPAPLPLLGTPKYVGVHNACKYYPELHKKFGPIFTVWKLTRPVVVLCGFEVVKDALVNHGDEFSGRPFFPVYDRYSGGYNFGRLRRFTIASLRNFGMGKTVMEKRVLEESQSLIQAVSQTGGKPFNPITLLACAVANVTSYALMGEHFYYEDPKLQELIITTRKFALISHNPLHEEEHLPGSHFCDNSLIMTVTMLLAAGMETTSSTLKFCLVVASNYPDVQRKVQQEIDEVTESQRPPGIMDRAQMPYTNAVVHEIQRIFDLAPTAHYHAVTKDTQFRGYTLPKGTIVTPFLTSVLSDPTQWETPNEFNPGHFLDDKGQFRTRPAFMAFSAGKRICAGESLARMKLFLLFSALLQNFTFSQPPGIPHQDCKQLQQNKSNHHFSQLCATPRSLSP